MSTITEERCLNHAGREAVARCPQCLSFFCRECITEHEGRVICASCLDDEAGSATESRLRRSLARPVLALASFILLWACFFALGRTLLLLPDSFHDGSVWSSDSETAADGDAP